MTSLALFGAIGPWEVIALLALGLLIFGKRLPEVGRSLGKGLVEFKKGLSGVEDEVNKAGQTPPADTQPPAQSPPPAIPPQSTTADAQEQGSQPGQHTTPSP